MSRPLYRPVGTLLALALTLGLVGCAPAAPPATVSDVLTQTVIAPGKIPVTVLVKYAFSIHAFEAAAEAKFPQLDIIQVGNYTSDMGVAEYTARMAHDDLTDIVMTWPLDAGSAYCADRLLDLSALPFTSGYNTARLDQIAQDGKLYYLPGPSQIRALVYNKTLFAERGWQVPQSFEEFVSLCQTIEQSGMRSLQLGLGNAEVLDTALVGFGHAGSFSAPDDAQWLASYNSGNGSLGEHFGPALDTFQTLIDSGILQKGDLDLHYQDREQMLFTRRCAMIEDSVLLARMGYAHNGCTDEFSLMPFWNPDGGEDWARLYPVCYIGLNRHLADPANTEKYDLVMDLMDYISTQAGQEALASDTGAMFSSLNDVPPPDIPEIDDLLPALEHGRYCVFPTLKNAQGALRKGLAGMVRGELGKEDVIAMVDAENSAPPTKAIPLVLGTATADFTMIETGNFVTDAMRAHSGSDVALFLDNGKDGRYNGKGISGRLYKGEQTSIDVGRTLPDLKHNETGHLWTVRMTGAELLATLEHAIPVDHNLTGWFYYFSGLRMAYNPAAAPGSRIARITDDKGGAIDPARSYTVAVMDGTVPDVFYRTGADSGTTIRNIYETAITSADTISPSGDGRFTITTT